MPTYLLTVERFEAAWRGDLDTIKSLTLAKWGPNNEQLPLRIAMKDMHWLSPFAIAVLRGHLQVGKSILEIVEAQYKPKEEEISERYRLDEDTNIYSEVIDEKFTIENIGEVATKVECRIKPLEVLNWNYPVTRFMSKRKDEKSKQGNPEDLIDYAIFNDDVALLVFLLELGQKHTERDASSETSIYRIGRNSFARALRLGRLRCLMEIIQRTGGSLPIDDLVRKSGVEVHDKPEYYQGLSIHGKKRPGWASGEARSQSNSLKSPPLLEAALKGCLESTEWFLGPAAGRYYYVFTETHKQDKQLKRLEESELGLDSTVKNWLGMRSKLSAFAVYQRLTNQTILFCIAPFYQSPPMSPNAWSSTCWTNIPLC